MKKNESIMETRGKRLFLKWLEDTQKAGIPFYVFNDACIWAGRAAYAQDVVDLLESRNLIKKRKKQAGAQKL